MSIGLETFRKTVSVAGTAEALSSTRITTPAFVIRALDSNSGKIYIGSSTSCDSTDGMFIHPNETNEKAARFTRYGVHKLWDLSKIYIDCEITGDGVVVEYEVDV